MKLQKLHWILITCLILSGCQQALPTPALPTLLGSQAPETSQPSLPTATATTSPIPTSTLLPTSAATLPSAQPVTRGPYLQLVQHDSIWVIWDTETPSTGWLEYGSSPALGKLAMEIGETLHHAVQIHGLQPAASYHYRVAGSGATYSFRTAPMDGGQPFRFALYGDTQSNTEQQAQISARLVEVRPDFVVHLGDLVADGREGAYWEHFFNLQAELLHTAPIFPVLGNHEEDAQNYFDIFHLPGNERWYSFDYGSARFIMLEVDDYIHASLQPGGEQRAWLEQELARERPRWLFVAFHIPIHGSMSEDPSEVNLRAQLAPLFEAAGVTAVFSGNFHHYERVVENGVTYIVSGGGGAPLDAFSTLEPGSLVQAAAHHFMVVDVQRDRVTGMVIDIDGADIDTFDLPFEN
jgi:acid phosphatase type 7